MVIAREALNGVVRDIKVSYDEAAKAPVSGFDEAQTKTAQDESPRVCRRLHSVRGWSHGETTPVFPRST